MKARFTHQGRAPFRTVVAAMLVCLIVLSTLPQSLFAQEASTPIFLPMISGGLAEPPSEEAPFEGFNQIPDDELETELLAEASRQLPEPAALAAPPDNQAATRDMDADGVPNTTDNCPHQPNPPTDGIQPETCGQALVSMIDNHVFLHSRIFQPFQGLDPALRFTQKRDRIHVILHVRPNDNGIMLTPQQRVNLQALGVNLLEYLPHNSFYASVPRDLTTLQQIVALDRVRGISALRPKDKVSPQLRVQGPNIGRNDDGTYSVDVDFFEDVPQPQIEALLTQASVPFVHQYDHTYRVNVADWQGLRRLVIQDVVHFVDDLPDEVYDRTLNAQALINGEVVSNTLGLRGNGIVVSMTEIGLAEPIDRTDMIGRVTLGNNPIFEPGASDGEHPQMVSGIMVSDGSTFPTRVGLLPEAQLISFSTAGLTVKDQYFGVNKDAKRDYGAILSNNSWGPNNCSKAGEYSRRGKFYDRAVYDEGIAIIYATGNTRGPNGTFAPEGCEAQLFSLPHPVAKNDISVGNWDINTNALQETSSAGPAIDGRLKPDLVAPGQGVDTMGWDEVNLVPEPIQGGGTSAASPVTAGVVGWLAESFLNQGMLLDTIMPARYKAILVHTAKDVGPTGPDFMHGYGLIQADRALRIAEEWSSWGREGLLNEVTTQLIYTFDVTTMMTFYKATLAWDDLEGDNSPTMALQNDLDLTLISPSGVVYYPYDIVLPLGATTDDGSVPCLNVACQDHVNNVEMVMVDPATDFIEQGTWQAVVNVFRLVNDEQDFSLVLTPPCPVEIDSSVTLTGDIACTPTPLEPTGVLIQTDGVNLNCDNHAIRGQDAGLLGFDGTYAGVRVVADDVTVRNCHIRQFDVGIKVEDGTNSLFRARIANNTLEENGTIGIELVGNDHLAQGNSVAEMLVSTGKGITVRGDAVTVHDNGFHLARNGGVQNNTVAILVHPASDNGTITSNDFDGLWWYGIRLRSLDPLKPVQGFLVDDNHFEGIEEIPIELLGEVLDSTVSNNEVTAYGSGFPGINLLASSDGKPSNNVVSGNHVTGFTNQAQLGIQLIDVFETSVTNNILSTVKVGISELNATNTVISGNTINPVMPANNYRTSVGISATNSATRSNITNNQIRFSTTGIVVDKPLASALVTVSENMVNVGNVGVSVANANAIVVSSNGIMAGSAAVTLQSSPNSAVSGNNINMNGGGVGIGVSGSNDSHVGGNTIALANVGIGINQTQGISVTGNTVTDPLVTGIVLDTDTAGQVDSNTVDNSVLGIHYQKGIDAVLSNNTVNSLAGGTGIRLGTAPAGCPVNVDNILVQDNVLTGGALGVEVLCDVGTHTLINN